MPWKKMFLKFCFISFLLVYRVESFLNFFLKLLNPQSFEEHSLASSNPKRKQNICLFVSWRAFLAFGNNYLRNLIWLELAASQSVSRRSHVYVTERMLHPCVCPLLHWDLYEMPMIIRGIKLCYISSVLLYMLLHFQHASIRHISHFWSWQFQLNIACEMHWWGIGSSLVN